MKTQGKFRLKILFEIFVVLPITIIVVSLIMMGVFNWV